MFPFLFRIGKWLLQKLAISILIAVVGLVGYGLWLFAQDRADFAATRQEQIAELVQKRDLLISVQADVTSQRAEDEGRIESEQKRIDKIDRIIEGLRSLESRWESWFGNRAQQKLNAEQIVRLKALRVESVRLASRWSELRRRAIDDEHKNQRAIDRLDRQIHTVESTKSRIVYYILTAWARSRLYFALAVLLYIAGPTVLRCILWTAIAPVIARGRPRSFARGADLEPEIFGGSRPLDVAIWPGEILRIKTGFLAIDAGVHAGKANLLFDWKMPLTSLLSGMWWLRELGNQYAGPEYRLSLLSQRDPALELTVLSLPEGGSMILRQGFLVGVIQKAQERCGVTTRWRLFRWHSWVTMQFRYVEFSGPCRLILATRGRLRAERLISRDQSLPPIRRLRKNRTVGFSPGLDCRPARAQSWWRYVRGKAPLFDEEYRGSGLVVVGSGPPNLAWRPFKRAWWLAMKSVGI